MMIRKMTLFALIAAATAFPLSALQVPQPDDAADLDSSVSKKEAKDNDAKHDLTPWMRPVMSVDARSLSCLTENVYWESRGEPVVGQAAVAHVTLNRVWSSRYPKEICDVVRQGGPASPCQFEWYCDDKPDNPTNMAAWQRAERVARTALRHPQDDPTQGALYFHHISLRPGWAQAYDQPRIIGLHVFFNLKNSKHAGDEWVTDHVALAQSDDRYLGQRPQAMGDIGEARHAGQQVALIRVAGEDHGGMPSETGQ